MIRNLIQRIVVLLGAIRTRIQPVLNHPRVVAITTWYQNTGSWQKLAVKIGGTVLVALLGINLIAKPIAWITGGIFSIFSSEEKIEILVDKDLQNKTITPRSIEVNAGELVELWVKNNEGLFVDGNKEANAFPPYSKKAYVQITLPDGERYRLTDKITLLESTSSGKATISVALSSEKGNRIWSGKNLEAERLSEFEKGKITLIVERPKTPNPNAMVAKIVEEDVDSADLKKTYDEQDKKVEEAVVVVRSKFKKFYDYTFNRPLTVETKN